MKLATVDDTERWTGTFPRRIVNRMVNPQPLDRTFSALSDPTRRSMLDRLSLGPATVSELAAPTGISLPGALKHVRILEEADLVTSEKRGRTRECRLGPAQLEDATAWIEQYRSRWERRLDRLEAVIDKRMGGSR
jgi:DNA-binding transcriptional ArsR family regulator